jgi:outer membrane autotransporter protein
MGAQAFQYLTAAFAALGLMILVPISSSHAQAPPLGTLANFASLANTGITNTGPTVITGTPANPGDIGSSLASITGFPPGIVTPPGVIHAIGDAPTITAQNSLTTAYNNLAGRTTTVDLTSQDLGGKTLVPGVYNFSSLAQLTGSLTLNGLGNPNSIFIFNIGSTLTTASASSVQLINGAQGGNVFWRVGSSATLGTTTSFAGDILAQASITLNTGAKITCGAAWARTGAVTLDSNTITICPPSAAPGTPGGPPLGPTGVPLLASLLPSSATTSDISVANAIDTFVGNGGTLPLAFLNLFNLPPAELANALTQLEGEAGTGAQESGFQMMNSFLSLLTNPFAENRGFAPANLPPRQPLIYKAPIYKAPAEAAPDPRHWSVWAAAYGGVGNIKGDPAGIGSNNLTTREGGFATGLDYRVAPDTIVGFALAGGGTSWGLAAGLGGGRSDVFQAGLYGLQQYGAAYLSGGLGYGSYWASTSRTLTFAGADTLNASYNAQNFGGRLEGGYRVTWLAPFSVIPYAAVEAQAFRTPGYSESGSLGAPDPFALSYGAQTGTLVRSELGSRFDQVFTRADGDSLIMFGRVAWAHDWQSNPNLTATFIELPAATFVVDGATPAKDLALVTAGTEWRWRNGWSLMAKFDGELAKGSDTYMGTARVRYMW